jgi:hypothetical protein
MMHVRGWMVPDGQSTGAVEACPLLELPPASLVALLQAARQRTDTEAKTNEKERGETVMRVW